MQTLPATQPQRLETGTLKIGNDWPGYFMRGDAAIGEANILKMLAGAIERGDSAVIKAAPEYLRRLAADLESCHHAA